MQMLSTDMLINMQIMDMQTMEQLIQQVINMEFIINIVTPIKGLAPME